MIKRISGLMTVVCALFFALPTVGRAQEEAADTRAQLEWLLSDGLWAEGLLSDGRVRSFQVVEMNADSVQVTEIYGALQRRSATYALADFSSVRVLGSERIQSRRAVYRSDKSMFRALVLEAIVPGGGYLYVGETRQALALWGLTGVAAATAWATGEDGAAGWAPLSVWLKAASLFHLRDKVQAMNEHAVTWDIEAGALAAEHGVVPFVGLRAAF